MKQTVAILLFSLLMACNTDSKKEEPQVQDSPPKTKVVNQSIKQEKIKPIESGDYSSLLNNYSCDMDIPEVAQVLEVSESDIIIPDYAFPNKCNFNLKGFGIDSGKNHSKLQWGSYPSSKQQIKTEINTYLKNKDEYAARPKVYQYMSIALADTGDCYIAHQPAHGRVIIYNENYGSTFMLHYGRKGAFKRTQEQHDELKAKMTTLANYLLRKHRK